MRALVRVGHIMGSTYSRKRKTKMGQCIERVALTPYLKGFLEALIDAEGYVTLKRLRNPRVKRGFTWWSRVGVSNTSKDFLEHITRLLGDGRVSISQKHGQYNPGWRAYYELRIPTRTLRWLLPQLRLVIKERQRQLLIEAMELSSQQGNGYTPHDLRLAAIYQELRILNKRGA